MNSAEGLEQLIPMTHRLILFAAVSCQSRAKDLVPASVSKPLIVPKIASGALEPAAALTKVHCRLWGRKVKSRIKLEGATKRSSTTVKPASWPNCR
jgi:hypothetical protein